MAAPTEAQTAHLQIIEQLDIYSLDKTFRNPSWRPNQRRNKNVKTIIMDASKREAASAAATPLDDNVDESGAPSTSGGSTPATGSSRLAPNLAQASRSLSKLVLEKSLSMAANGDGDVPSAPSATYTNIESAPSLAHTKNYCDITGLAAPYVDPKTRLRYHNKEVFAVIRSLPPGVAEQYLEVRGAHTVLK